MQWQIQQHREHNKVHISATWDMACLMRSYKTLQIVKRKGGKTKPMRFLFIFLVKCHYKFIS